MRRLLIAVGVILLVAGFLPVASAQTGGGQSDVRPEPTAPVLDDPDSTVDVDVGNGFPENPSDTGGAGYFSPGNWTLVLDGFYGKNVWPVSQQVEVNNIQRHLLEEVAGVDDVHQEYIFPGRTDFSVWWGWWNDIEGFDESEEDVTPSGDETNGDEGRIYDINDVRDNQASANLSPACDQHEGINPAGAICGSHQDEFTWRGDSEFMVSENHDCLPDCGSFPGDKMRLFIQPGTVNINFGSPDGALLLDTKDDGRRPDAKLVDDTSTEDGQGYFLEGNNWGYNYHQSLFITTRVVTSVNPEPLGTEGFFDPFSHPDDDDDGADMDDGASDTDYYSSVAPAVEDVYRFAVWDPHDGYDCASATDTQTEKCQRDEADPDDRGDSPFPQNPVPGFGTADDGSIVTEDQHGDRGVFEAAKFGYNTGGAIAGDEAVEAQTTALGPISSTNGFANLVTNGEVQLHEPNVGSFDDPYTGDTIQESYPGADFSNTNADARYVADTDETTPFYFDAGADSCNPDAPTRSDCPVPDGWDGYATKDLAWADAEGEMQVPCWCVLGYGDSGFFVGTEAYGVTPNTGASAGDREAQQTMTPGNLHIDGMVGKWHDVNDDDFIGDLSERGRFTAADAPYFDGSVEDPNDYGDTASATSSDPAKSGFAEWVGLASEVDGNVTVTLTPLTEPDPTAPADQNRPFGELGIYLQEDTDTNRSANFNPWDDAVADSVPEPLYWGENAPEEQACQAAGEPISCEDPGWLVALDDDDGERMSKHITHGPIELDYVPSEFETAGELSHFEIDEDIIVPRGSLEYPIMIEVDVEMPQDKTIEPRDGGNIADTQGELTEGVTEIDVLLPSDGSFNPYS